MSLMQASPARRVLIAAALTVASMLAVYPAGEAGAAGFWWAVDMLLLLLAFRGRRWAGTILFFTTAFGAALFVVAGASQLLTQPRYLERGAALAVATALLLQARRAARQPSQKVPLSRNR